MVLISVHSERPPEPNTGGFDGADFTTGPQRLFANVRAGWHDQLLALKAYRTGVDASFVGHTSSWSHVTALSWIGLEQANVMGMSGCLIHVHT